MAEQINYLALKDYPVTTQLAESSGMDAGGYLSTLTKTVGGNLSTTAEVAAFMTICKRYNLDPLIKEIYVFKNSYGALAPIVGCDGWYGLMNKHPEYDGHDLEVEWVGEGEHRKIFAITCKMYRKDRSHPTVHTEYFRACNKGTAPWKSHPERMLEAKAISQTVRIAFSISGIYDDEEAEDVEQGIEYREVPNILDKHETETDNAGKGKLTILEPAKPAKIKTSKAKQKQEKMVSKPKVVEKAPPPVEDEHVKVENVEEKFSSELTAQEKQEQQAINEQLDAEEAADERMDKPAEPKSVIESMLPENDKRTDNDEPKAEMPNHEKPLIKPRKLTPVMKLILTEADKEHTLFMTFDNAVRKRAARKNCGLQEAYKQLLEKYDVKDLAALNEDKFAELET